MRSHEGCCVTENACRTFAISESRPCWPQRRHDGPSQVPEMGDPNQWAITTTSENLYHKRLERTLRATMILSIDVELKAIEPIPKLRLINTNSHDTDLRFDLSLAMQTCHICTLLAQICPTDDRIHAS